jgi:ATP-binding cassette subfamily B protein
LPHVHHGQTCLAKLAAVGVPLLLKDIVDRFSRAAQLVAEMDTHGALPVPGVHTVMLLPVFLLLGYALLRFCSTLFTELRDLIFARVTLRTVAAFAEKTFAHLLLLSPSFHMQRNTGVLIRDIERGISGIGFLLGAGLFTVLPTLVEFTGVLLVLAAGYSLWFTLVIVMTFFVYAAYTMTLTQRRALRQRRVNEVDSHATGRLVDSLINYETVKTHAREDFERARYRGVLEEWIEHSLRNQQALSTLHLGQGAIIGAGVAAMMLLAAEQTLRGAMTVGDLVLVNAYVIQICLPLNALGFVFREARDALVNTEQLFALLGQRSETEERPGSQPLQVRGSEVVFEHVDFSYQPGRQVLQDIGFTIPAGKTVAVVGGSGSGKSTLARLLLRLYDVERGRITIDGQDVRELTMASLREAIGVVPQDTVLFNDTIAYNIGYGRISAGMSDVIEAAKAAQVHEFILSLPQQYETIVGERGLKLSGGEKQRIAIARAFLKNPPLMIFDEATSALDTRAERAIQRELDRIAQGRSTLVIAHRLSTIVNADRIIVLDMGRIVEQGRHDELLTRDALYAQLWSLQRQQQQVDRLQRELACQPMNLAALLAGLIEGLRPAIEARGVRLFTDIDSEHASVVGDPSTLSQALRALLLSALRATPMNGRIEISLERRNGNVRLSIADGRQAWAGPLQQPADEAETPPDPLALRSTIERQGGRFSVEAPTSISGMRYLVELPLHTLGVEILPPVGPVLDPGAAPGAGVLQGLRVMCIDDTPDALVALRLMLEPEGTQVLPFNSGQEAVAWLAGSDSAAWPHVIVCDVVLGDEDGHQVIRRIRRIEAERGLPLERRMPAVALTGPAHPGDRLRALMAGFQAHLANAVDAQELTATLRKLAAGIPRENAPDAPLRMEGPA